MGHLLPGAALCGRQIEVGVLHNDHEMSNVSGMVLITICKNVDCKGYLLPSCEISSRSPRFAKRAVVTF